MKHASAQTLHDTCQALASAVEVILWDNVLGTSTGLLNLYSLFPRPGTRQLFTSLCLSKPVTFPYPPFSLSARSISKTPKQVQDESQNGECLSSFTAGKDSI